MRRRGGVPDLIHRLVRRVGFRGYFLLTLGTVDIFQGLNFVQPGDAGQAVTNRYLSAAIPVRDLDVSNWIWACAWWLVAVVCFVNAFKTSRDHWGFVTAIAIKVAMVASLIYATAHGLGDGPRRVIVWSFVASSVWVMSRLPEPPWSLVDLNDELERTGEISPIDGGEDRDA